MATTGAAAPARKNAQLGYVYPDGVFVVTAIRFVLESVVVMTVVVKVWRATQRGNKRDFAGRKALAGGYVL